MQYLMRCGKKFALGWIWIGTSADLGLDHVVSATNPIATGSSQTLPSSANKKDIPWEISTREQNRPVAQFGFRYDYVRDVVVINDSDNDNDATVKNDESTPTIPPVLQKMLHCHDKDTSRFKQCIINAYGSNDTAHIPWHKDDAAFGPLILVYTFGAARPLHLRRRRRQPTEGCGNDTEEEEEAQYDYFTAFPRHLSCYILSGEARHEWEHAVPAGSAWRISITFRSLG